MAPAPLPTRHAMELRAATLKTHGVLARLRAEATRAHLAAAPAASPSIRRLRARPEAAADLVEGAADPDAAARAVVYVAFGPWSCDATHVERALARARGRAAHRPLLAALGGRSDVAQWVRRLDVARAEDALGRAAAFLRAAVAEAALLTCPEWLVAEAAAVNDVRLFGACVLAPAFALLATDAPGADVGGPAATRASPLALAWASGDAVDRYARRQRDRRASARRAAALRGDLQRFLGACRAWSRLDADRFTREALAARRRKVAAPPAPPAIEGHWCATRAELRVLGDDAPGAPDEVLVGTVSDADDADAAVAVDAEAQARRVAHAWAEARRRRAAMRAAAAPASARPGGGAAAPPRRIRTAPTPVSVRAAASAGAAPRYARPTEAWAAAPRRRSLGELRPDEQRRYFEDMLRRPWRDVDAQRGAAPESGGAAASRGAAPAPAHAAAAAEEDDDDDGGFDQIAFTRDSERAGGYGGASDGEDDGYGGASDGEDDDDAFAYIELSGGEDSGESVSGDDGAAPAAHVDSEDDAGASVKSDDGTASTASEVPAGTPTPAYAGELFAKRAGRWRRVAAQLVADGGGAVPALVDAAADEALVRLAGCGVASTPRMDLAEAPGRFFFAVKDGDAVHNFACASVVARDAWVAAIARALDAWAGGAAARTERRAPEAAPAERTRGGREVRGLALLAPPGVRVLKHCRHAKPHACFLVVDVHGAYLAWTKKRAQSQQGSVAIGEITDVTVGLATPVLARHGTEARGGRYVSIVTRFRTLDVECDSVEVRDDLAAAVDFLRDVK